MHYPYRVYVHSYSEESFVHIAHRVRARELSNTPRGNGMGARARSSRMLRALAGPDHMIYTVSRRLQPLTE